MLRRSTVLGFGIGAMLLLSGCPSVPPPKSPPPSTRALIDRMRATTACGASLRATSKIDYFGDQGRIRVELMMLAEKPASLRMDVVSPFGATLATLTSDNSRFTLADFRNKQFLTGTAAPCNIARLTHLPIPGPVLVGLLRGNAPILKHEDRNATFEWSGRGHYAVTIRGANDTVETLALEPHPDDRQKNWNEQRFRVKNVSMVQEGITLYTVELGDHRPVPLAKLEIDPEDALLGGGTQNPVAACDAELPRKMKFEIPTAGDDVLFRYDEIVWNPSISKELFQQSPPAGMDVGVVDCERK